MGYEIYITRHENWFDEDEAKRITIEEWKKFVEGDPEMRMDNYAEVKLKTGNVLRVEEEGLTVWMKYSGNISGGNQAWFGFSDGNISVKNPDEEIMMKMLSIADVFNAKLQGEEGEVYDVNKIRETFYQLQAYTRKATKPWWKFW